MRLGTDKRIWNLKGPANRHTDAKTTQRWLFKQISPAKAWVGLSVGLGFASGLLLIVQAGFLARIIHSAVIDGKSRETLWPLFVALVGIYLVRSLLGWGREVSGFEASAKIRRQVRSAIMAHITRLGPTYVSGRNTGALASTVMEQVEGLHGFFAHYLPQMALAIMIPVAILTFVFPVSWVAGSLLMITAPLIPLFMVLVGMGAESVSQRNFQALSRMSAHFLDILQGLPTLKLFHKSQGEEKNVAQVSRAYRKRTMSVLRIAFLSSAVLELFSAIAIAMIAVFLGMTYLGYYNIGTWGLPLTLSGGFFILLLAPEFYLPLRDLGTHYHARAEAIGAAQEILKVLALPVPASPEKPMVFEPSGGVELSFKDVHLAYDGGRRPALNGISFTINAGEKIALVGESGAGKTTVLDLLLGFLNPDCGQITANGICAYQLDPTSRLGNISWIGQDPALFYGSIRDNIRMGRPDATEEALVDAARSARVLDFTQSLPQGLDTVVGERGYGLSRGQAQRIALARAFLKAAPVLLLDEPTAGLDVENEYLVLAALDKLSAGRTVLIVTHRMADVEKADRILVMSGGRIVEQGTFGSLSTASGVFQLLATRHSEEDKHG
jgi:ATP-binding cassette subfamily C protein CydD